MPDYILRYLNSEGKSATTSLTALNYKDAQSIFEQFFGNQPVQEIRETQTISSINSFSLKENNLLVPTSAFLAEKISKETLQTLAFIGPKATPDYQEHKAMNDENSAASLSLADFKSMSVTELEAYIGVPAQLNTVLNQKMAETALKSYGKSMAMIVWLEKKGVDARKSTDRARSAAYNSANYLAAWRRNKGDKQNLLDDDDAQNKISLLDDGDGADEGSKAEVKEEGEKQAEVPPLQTKAQTEAFLTDLFKQINTTVEKLVKEKMSNASISLDASAKEAIKTLARSAAKEEAEKWSRPQTIEILNAEAGTKIDIGMQHESFPLLLRACSARDHRGFRLNIWLTGPTGSGKTTAGENVAKALALPFGSDGSLDADYKVLGFRDANGNIISTQFLKIYENGGIYIADEIDNWLPSALLSLNAALANGWISTPGGLIQRHKDACVIACANTWGLGATGEYVGRTKLDAASLDRFQPKIDWPYDEKLERAIANNLGGQDGLDWHDTIVDARSAASTSGAENHRSPGPPTPA